MRRHMLWSWLLLVLVSPVLAQDEPLAPPREERAAPPSKKDYSYAIGLNIGRSLKQDDVAVDLEQVIAGLTDGIEGSKPRLTDQQIQQAMLGLQRELQARAEAKFKELADKNLKEGEAFLAANKKKEGVQTLPSGLQYKVIKAGKGKSPAETDTVKVHYHGTLTDGTVFDSSRERGEPAEFRVDRVIPGWTEAVQKMKVGDKWQLFIPPDLAYGKNGTPDGSIGPNSVLVFEVELLGINGGE